jgi:hypothetical protein
MGNSEKFYGSEVCVVAEARRRHLPKARESFEKLFSMNPGKFLKLLEQHRKLESFHPVSPLFLLCGKSLEQENFIRKSSLARASSVLSVVIAESIKHREINN